MFKRIYHALFLPKKLGLFMTDKIYFSILYLIGMFILCVAPLIVIYNNLDKGIDLESFNAICAEIPDDANAQIVDGTFTTDTAFEASYSVASYSDYYVFLFGSDDVSSDDYWTFSMQSDSVVVYYQGRQEYSISYESTGVGDIDFNSIATSSADRTSFNEMVDYIFENDIYQSNTEYAEEEFAEYFFELVIFIGLMYFASRIAPYIKPSYRFNITIYSLTWLFVFLFIENAFSLSYISIIGVILAFITQSKALRAIKVVRVRKK